jgi:hypothetical protein
MPPSFLSDANFQIFGIRRTPPTFVKKEKKKVHKKSLTVKTYYVGRVQPHSPELLAESRAKLLELAAKDKERMMLEEAKNKVESYIYKTKKQREEVEKLANAAEEWLYEDGYSADLATMVDKYAELSVPFEKILLRISESTARPDAVEKFRAKLTEIEGLMAKWEESKPQVTEEERSMVLKLVEEVRKWIEDKEKAQAKKKAHEEPIFVSDEVPLQLKPIESMVVRLSRKPKPKPPKEEKNETSTENATATTDANSTADDAAATNTTAEAANATAETSNSSTTTTTTEDEPTVAADVDDAAADSSSTKVPVEGVQDEL